MPSLSQARSPDTPTQQAQGSSQDVAGRSGGLRGQARLGNQAMQERLLGPERHSYGARTTCDLDRRHWPADVQELFARKKDLPVDKLGAGEPVIDYLPAFQAAGPGMQRIIRAHEEVHVANARPFSHAFKADLDAAASGWVLGLAGDRYVASDDYIRAYNKHHGGMHPDCEVDEKLAYAESVRVSKQVLADPTFAAERETIQATLDQIYQPEARQPTTCGK